MFEKAVGVTIALLVLIIAFYVAIALFLNKFNKLVYGKGTPMCWIPICNTYLLGKLAVNKLVGWILVICIFLTGKYTITTNGVENVYTILPENISSTVSNIYNIVVFVLFIYAIFKYNKLKNSVNV